MTKKQNVLLIFWFYLGWFGCVYFAKWNISQWSFVFPAVPFLFLVALKKLSFRALLFLALISLIGVGFDSLAYNFNLVSFHNHSSAFLPIWLLSMWFLFSTVVPLSHDLFKSKLWLAAILGAIFGPLSYYSGEAFDVLLFQNQSTIFVYALFWGCYFPMIHLFYRKMI